MQSFIEGKVYSFILEVGFGRERSEEFECFSHERVNEIQRETKSRNTGTIYFTRYQTADGAIEKQLGYGVEAVVGGPAFKLICAKCEDPEWISGEPTIELLSRDYLCVYCDIA